MADTPDATLNIHLKARIIASHSTLPHRFPQGRSEFGQDLGKSRPASKVKNPGQVCGELSPNEGRSIPRRPSDRSLDGGRGSDEFPGRPEWEAVAPGVLVPAIGAGGS